MPANIAGFLAPDCDVALCVEQKRLDINGYHR